MNELIKTQLVIKPLIFIIISLCMALFIIYFVSSNITFIKFPAFLGYIVIFGFLFRPVLKLILNLFLIKKWQNGGSPSCPTCSLPMKNRIARRGRYKGQHFWGCFSYPKCKGKRHIG